MPYIKVIRQNSDFPPTPHPADAPLLQKPRPNHCGGLLRYRLRLSSSRSSLLQAPAASPRPVARGSLQHAGPAVYRRIVHPYREFFACFSLNTLQNIHATSGTSHPLGKNFPFAECELFPILRSHLCKLSIPSIDLRLESQRR